MGNDAYLIRKAWREKKKGQRISPARCLKSGRLRFLDRVEKPEAGFLPIALHRIDGNAQRFAGFLDAQAAEVTQLDDLGLALVDRGELFQQVVNGDDVELARARGE